MDLQETRDRAETLPGKGLWGARLFCLPSIGSTNEWMNRRVPELRHGDAVSARAQTAGRGRFGRVWVAPPDRSLALSVFLAAAEAPPSRAPLAAPAAALAVRAALASFGLDPRVKWPNDVLVRDRKISGILLERHPETGDLILGIGVNVSVTEDDLSRAGLSATATSVRIETAVPAAVEAVRNAVTAELERTIVLAFREGTTWLLPAWNACDALAGRTIRVLDGEASRTGRYAGLDDQARLRLVDGTGAEHRFWTGDVTVRL